MKHNLTLLSTALAALSLSATMTCAAPPADVSIPVAYSAPADGFLSLALYNEKGQLVRSLLYAQPVKAGQGSVVWDGTSDLGVPQPAGTYTTKGIFFRDKVRLEYVMTVGKSGNPPYRTPDGKGDWGGNLGGPGAICANADSVMMVWNCVEDNQITGIQQMDAEGNIALRYFSFYPWDVRQAGAMDERNFYLGILNWDKKQLEIAAYELGKPRGKILAALPTKPHQEQGDTRWRGRFHAQMNGLAVNDDTVFATIAADDALFLVDRATGAIRKQIAIPSPRGVQWTASGLLLQNGNRILRLTRDGKVEKTLVDEGVLDEPGSLAVTADGGFFSDGAGGQVARFGPDGRLIAKIGKPGGTPRTGRYDPSGFGRVQALAIGPKDGWLWVQDINGGFPRTSRWTLDGKLDREWFGDKPTLSERGINPANPQEILQTSDGFSDEPGIRAWTLDWERKTWRPSWFYDTDWKDMFSCTDVYLGYGHGGNPLSGPRGGDDTWPVFHYTTLTFVSHGGKNFFMNEDGNSDGAIFQYSADHRPKPVALVGFHHVARREDGKFQGSYDQGRNEWMTWADRNGDGKMFADEITHVRDVAALQGAIRVSAARLDADLNVHLKMFGSGNFLLPPKEILPGGIPVYDWSMARKQPDLTPDFSGGDGTKKVSGIQMPFPLEAEDGIYALAKPEAAKQLSLPGIDGEGWWAGRNWRTKLVKFDKATGEVLWAVGRRAPGVAEPGQMYHPVALSGKVGDVLFVADTLGPVWLWHSDGLFLGHVLKDFPSGETGVPPDQANYGETQSTGIFRHPATGKSYHVGLAGIHEVKLPAIQRLSGKSVKLTPDQAKQAKAWDPDGLAPTEKPRVTVYPAPGKAPGAVEVKIDGNLDGREGWFGFGATKTQNMLVLMDGQALAHVRVMYDAENLYLGYKVSHPGGPANSGSELPYAPFVSGAYVDFSIASDWSQPQRPDVREGDVRVLLARVRDSASAESDFHQGFWQKKTGGTNSQTITSPAAKVHFDQISTVPGLQAAYKVDPRKDEKSGNIRYTVEVSVPLASLGLKDVAGKTIGFDVSVGTANAAGDNRERAAHWAGLSESRVVDRPGSAELLPRTWGTLKFAPAAK